jgi:hypothetical protein
MKTNPFLTTKNRARIYLNTMFVCERVFDYDEEHELSCKGEHDNITTNDYDEECELACKSEHDDITTKNALQTLLQELR